MHWRTIFSWEPAIMAGTLPACSGGTAMAGPEALPSAWKAPPQSINQSPC